MHIETFDHSIKDKHAKICSETIDGSGSSKYSNSNPEVINGSGSSIGSERQVDVMTRGENDKNNYSATHVNGTKGISASARRSSSSSLSESSSYDFFGMDTLKFTTSGASTSKSEKNSVSSSESSTKSEVDNSPLLPTSKCQVYNVTHNQKGTSPIVSPPIQVMDRSGGYNPSRIPSSVFERNTNPSEWSTASNDSLFSIHIGNNSFSRENMFGELSMSQELTKSGELNMFSRTPSVIGEETDTARKSVDVENPQTTETSDEVFKLEERCSEDQNEIKNSRQSASCKSSKTNVSNLSHGSGNSAHSFTFPIKKHARPLCYCSNCSWAFCCYKWPRCKSSNCGWAFCYCWNCSYTKSCDHASPILTEAERNSSVKTDVPQQQSYKQESEVSGNSTASSCSCFQSKQTSEVTSNSTANCCNWFHCFSCPSCTWRPSCSGCTYCC